MKRLFFLIILCFSVVFLVEGQTIDKDRIKTVRKEILEEAANIKCPVELAKRLHKDWGPIKENSDFEKDISEYGCEGLIEDLLYRECDAMFIRFQVQKEDSGIQKGDLILFGHYLEPPYKLEYNSKNYMLSLNGIDLWPYQLKLIDDNPEAVRNDLYYFLKRIYFYQIEFNERKAMKGLNTWMIEITKKVSSNDENEIKEPITDILLKSLNWYLNTGFYQGYYIYDLDKLSFDLRGHYIDRYMNIPEDYQVNKTTTDKINDDYHKSEQKYLTSKKYDQEVLKNRHEKYQNILNNLEDNAVTIVSIKGSVIKMNYEDFLKPLLILQSDLKRYQKIFLLEKCFKDKDDFIAEELLSNYIIQEYIPLDEKLMNLKEGN